jgi:hypothetical protein
MAAVALAFGLSNGSEVLPSLLAPANVAEAVGVHLTSETREAGGKPAHRRRRGAPHRDGSSPPARRPRSAAQTARERQNRATACSLPKTWPRCSGSTRTPCCARCASYATRASSNSAAAAASPSPAHHNAARSLPKPRNSSPSPASRLARVQMEGTWRCANQIVAGEPLSLE